MQFIVEGIQTQTGKRVRFRVKADDAAAASAKVAKQGVQVTGVVEDAAAGGAAPQAAPAARAVAVAPAVAAPQMAPSFIKPIAPVAPRPPASATPSSPSRKKWLIIGGSAAALCLLLGLLVAGVAVWYFKFYNVNARDLGYRKYLAAAEVSETSGITCNYVNVEKSIAADPASASSSLAMRIPGGNQIKMPPTDVRDYCIFGTGYGSESLLLRTKSDKPLAEIPNNPGDTKQYAGYDYIECAFFARSSGSGGGGRRPGPGAGGPPPLAFVAKISKCTYLICTREDNLKKILTNLKAGKSATFSKNFETILAEVDKGDMFMAHQDNMMGAQYNGFSGTFKGGKVQVRGIGIFNDETTAAKSEEMLNGSNNPMAKTLTDRKVTRNGQTVTFSGNVDIKDARALPGL